MKRCADCGSKVEGGHRRNGWWTTVGDGTAARLATCRVVLDGNRLVSADYHYVSGETQRHFPLDTASPIR